MEKQKSSEVDKPAKQYGRAKTAPRTRHMPSNGENIAEEYKRKQEAKKENE